MLAYSREDIVALATAPGMAALAIVRLSGENLATTYKLFTHKKPKNRIATFCKVYHPKTNDILDEAVITYFKAPNSFTGEDIIEISCHGGDLVSKSIISAAIHAGARTAEPGEFSLRAFLNGKIDLIQAEAISALISSKADLSTKISLQHLDGCVSRSFQKIKTKAINVLSIIEKELDFSENEIDMISYKDIRNELFGIKKTLETVLNASFFGKSVCSGFRVVLFGRTNSGKSSLFNTMLGIDRAIVSSVPGTTRDTVEAWIDVEGVPVCLVDTAGVWESDKYLDKLGVQKTLSELDRADLCIIVDENDPFLLFEKDLSDDFISRSVFVQSKCDNSSTALNNDNIIYTSSTTGFGVDRLLTYISTFIINNINDSKVLDYAMITNRQRKLLESSLGSLNDAISQLDAGLGIDIVSSSIRGFIIDIRDVVGEIPNRDVFNHVFSNFCIGK